MALKPHIRAKLRKRLAEASSVPGPSAPDVQLAGDDVIRAVLMLWNSESSRREMIGNRAKKRQYCMVGGWTDAK